MNLPRSTLIIALMAIIIAALSWALVYYSRDEFKLAAERRDDDIPTHSAVTVDDGFAVVRVSVESQKASGIVTTQLETAHSDAATEVYGVVLNPQPLLDLRGRYLAAVAEARASSVAAASSHAEYERLKKLFDDDRNISERALLTAESQWKGDQARLAASEQSVATLQDNLRATWGAVFAGWAGDGRAATLDALANQREVVIQMAYPYDLQSAAGRAAMFVAPVSEPSTRRATRFVSASPQVDSTLPGATYFYLADGQGLRIGMRVVGQVKLGAKPREGVIVPASALVWHGGKAWAYVREGSDKFVRKLVPTAQEMGNGWFTAEGFEPDDDVVVSGAQLLLSEELKFQIRNENED